MCALLDSVRLLPRRLPSRGGLLQSTASKLALWPWRSHHDHQKVLKSSSPFRYQGGLVLWEGWGETQGFNILCNNELATKLHGMKMMQPQGDNILELKARNKYLSTCSDTVIYPRV